MKDVRKLMFVIYIYANIQDKCKVQIYIYIFVPPYPLIQYPRLNVARKKFEN
jgi:hypothetical protein